MSQQVQMKISDKATLLAAVTLFCLPSLLIKPALAEAPSLGNGIMCVARGKTDKGTKIYFYTSVIDDASMQKKQSVSVSIIAPVTDIAEGELVILDKNQQSITIDDFAAATPPQMQPVGLALTTYQGNNTFKGKSQAGTPLSFSLDNNYRVFKLQHGNASYIGVCH